MTDRSKQAGLYILERFGLPTLLLIGVAWWVRNDVLQPLTQTHIKFVSGTAEAVGKITEAERSQAAALEQMSRIMVDQARCLEDLQRTARRPAVSTQTTTAIGHDPGT